MQLKITVNFFGQVKLIVGKESDVGEYDDAIDLRGLCADLATRYGDDFKSIVVTENGQLSRSLLILINAEAVDKSQPLPLTDGDEVSLLPPTAGG